MARVRHFEPEGTALTGSEQADLTGCWWTLEELAATRDDLVPRDLAVRLRGLLAEGPPPEPIDVGV